MKRKIAIVAAALLVFLAGGCGSSDSNPSSLRQGGLDIAETLDFLAENEEAVKAFGASAEIAGIIEEIGEQEYSAPRVVFEIRVLREAMLESMAGEIPLSQELKDVIGYRFDAALSTQINNMGGVELIAASNILSYTDSFCLKGVDKPVTYLYLYDTRYGVMVHNTPLEREVISAVGGIVGHDAFSTIETVEDLSALLEGMGIKGAEITLNAGE